jgi:flagellar biosynthesis protein FlhG|tara:strand:+ start:542 stop:1339 length:798 start_codon:yes stop_codon:yes gene_type:complete
MEKPNTLEQPFVFAVISGKGGVGKSMASVNTATMLNQLGYKVALLDADLGLANCATLLNEPVSATVSNWIQGNCGLDDLPYYSSGITLVTGANEPGQNRFDTDLFMDALDQVVAYLKDDHDFIIIDTPAGAGDMALWALDTSDVGVLVLVDEPTAISDVYRLCKYVFNIDPAYRFASIVNYAENEETAENTYERFNTILTYFLQKNTNYLGFIPASDRIRESVQQQKPLIHLETEPELLKEFEFIAQNIMAYAQRDEKATLKTVY